LKIVFLCGSLEPGRDGVGDYVRLLAAKVMTHGHEASIVALNDYHITNEYKGIQKASNIDLNVLRIPASFRLKKRIILAQKWINVFAPEWISLQFVPYAFHSKGLPFLLSFYLQKLAKHRKVHIMFHELWIGINTESSIYHIFFGSLQRFLIRFLIKKAQPKVIHTHTHLYQYKISKLGLKPAYLPLFSNISKFTANDRVKSIIENKQISFVLFGSIHPKAPLKNFVEEVVSYARNNKVHVSLVIIGLCGNEAENWARAWKRSGLTVKIFGAQSPACISEILSSASIGISTTPVLLAEKSGAVAAMREHGLPIISISKPWHPRGTKNLVYPDGVQEYHLGSLESCLQNLKTNSFYYTISYVSCQFINALSNT
jgi:hypothetical protein